MTDYDAIIHALDQRGWAIADHAIPRAWCAALREEAQQLWQAGQFEAGEFGLDPASGKEPEVRGDAICWVQPGSRLAGHDFFTWMANFRAVLNERYPLGLRSQEFHFARYPGGRGYRKHLDQHRGRNFRKVSVVLYLNAGWDPADGGELCLYEPRDPEVEMRRVVPLEARLAVFMSGLVPHAVLPCRATRWSVTGWLRTDTPPG